MSASSEPAPRAHPGMARFSAGQKQRFQHSARVAATDEALRRSLLNQVIRQTVITRLRLAHPEPVEQAFKTAAWPANYSDDHCGTKVAAHQVSALVALLLREDEHVLQFTNGLLAGGTTLDGVFLDLVPRAAGLLRTMLNDGICDPADVTIGCWGLMQLVRKLSSGLRMEPATHCRGRRALLVSVDMEPPAVEMMVTAAYLGGTGLDVWNHAPNAADSMAQMARREWFAVVAVVADSHCPEHLARGVRAIRRASCNPDLRVLVSGSEIARQPDLATRVGADAAAGDARQAAAQALRLLTLMPAPI